jgi:hypothetical protein
MTLRRRPLAILALTLLGSLAPCLGGCNADTGTVVYVTLRGRLAMHTPATIDVVVSNAGGAASQGFTLEPGQRLPLTFTVTPTGRTGTLHIEASARFAGGESAGRGSVDVTIAPDRQVDADLVLFPDDFVVNKSIPQSQFIVIDEDQDGRQIAAAPDGSFVTAFENDCGPLSRCDVLARLFDKTATPARNGTSLDDGDLILNQQPLLSATPVIAGGKDGFLAAWLIQAAGRPDADLRATVLGRDAGHKQSLDLDVSVDPADDVAPTAFALADGSYVVVWERVRADMTREVRARRYGSDGTPLVNGVTSTTGDYPVSSVSTSNQRQSHGVGLASGGFVIVWVVGSNISARVFDKNATPSGADVALTSYAGATIYQPRVAATKDGFVAAWQGSGSAELSQHPVVVQRFDSTGASLSTQIQAVTQAVSLKASPGLAVRASDGAIGITWPDCFALGDGDGCGIKFRLLRPSGQPVGDVEGVNTTTKASQTAPSIAAVADDGFVIGWTDNSQLPPDDQESGVRARVIYPSLDRHDGKLGAICGATGDAACAEGLTCQPAADNQQLCHQTCTGACPAGGTCVNGAYCAFQ